MRPAFLGRHALPGLLLLATLLHVIGLVRTTLPAQDGLRFIGVARQFQARPWTDVVRGSDRHPLYPALIALTQPLAAACLGPGPDSWRVAAQGVAALAAIALLIPLHGLARAVFDRRTADLAALLYVLLPLPAEVGHDTLADPVALLGFAWSLRLGEVALRTRRAAPAVGCGMAAGLGYLARPEVAVAPLAVILARGMVGLVDLGPPYGRGRYGPFAALAIVFPAMVGGYAMVKGEVSEKLALRRGVALPSVHDAPRRHRAGLPRGLDNPRLDFSPKEESDAPRRSSLPRALGRVAARWTEAMGGVLVPLALWGALRVRSSAGRVLIATYLAVFAAVLVRHAMTLGYLSGRHTLTMVVATVPWAAAGLIDCARRIAARVTDPSRAWRLGVVGLGALIVVGGAAQAKPGHASRWGHRAAARWLVEHSTAADAILDTRGWVAFLAQRPAYDSWHVRQALTDAHLRYIVVGRDELEAPSRRAATMRALLAFAAEPVADFPGHRGGSDVAVCIFRFHRPESWEGLRP